MRNDEWTALVDEVVVERNELSEQESVIEENTEASQNDDEEDEDPEA